MKACARLDPVATGAAALFGCGSLLWLVLTLVAALGDYAWYRGVIFAALTVLFGVLAVAWGQAAWCRLLLGDGWITRRGLLGWRLPVGHLTSVRTLTAFGATYLVLEPDKPSPKRSMSLTFLPGPLSRSAVAAAVPDTQVDGLLHELGGRRESGTS